MYLGKNGRGIDKVSQMEMVIIIIAKSEIRSRVVDSIRVQNTSPTLIVDESSRIAKPFAYISKVIK